MPESGNRYYFWPVLGPECFSDLSGADSSTVSVRTSQLEFHQPQAIQANPGKGDKQPVRIRKKWTQEENRIVMECYYRNKPKINGYRQQMHAIWTDKGMFNITEQRLMESQIRKFNKVR